MLKRALSVAVMGVIPSLLSAQVPIVDVGASRSDRDASRPLGTEPTATPGFIPPVETEAAPANSQAEIFFQLQTLQQEVLELRGLVEEQAFEIKRLKQQRLDDYLDLDRRLSALSGNTPKGAGSGQPAAGGNSGGALSGQSAQPLAGEANSYLAAYDLLKKRQIDQAAAAFREHLVNYPQGKYAANAHYWLGEIYLLKNDLEAARQWFTKLLDGFQGHRKVPDAKFKLGKVYDLMGDKVKARALLEEVAASGTDASRLAKSYLQQHYQ